MGNTIGIAVILQILGVLVIIAEFILPSGGLLSVAAVGLIGYSLYHVFSNAPPIAGVLFVGADIILIPLSIVIGLKILANSPVTLRSSLGRSDGVHSADSSLEGYLDREGTALTDLHPAGKALIEGKRLGVVSRGEYRERNAAIWVIEIRGNRILVGKK